MARYESCNGSSSTSTGSYSRFRPINDIMPMLHWITCKIGGFDFHRLPAISHPNKKVVSLPDHSILVLRWDGTAVKHEVVSQCDYSSMRPLQQLSADTRTLMTVWSKRFGIVDLRVCGERVDPSRQSDREGCDCREPVHVYPEYSYNLTNKQH